MISSNELVNINGGKKKANASGNGWVYLGFGVGAVVSFITGLIDGYLRPLSCNK